jgi:hypothetical protein
MKVAVIGLWSETHGLAPWSDPQWEKWGLAWDPAALRMDRVFEVHLPREWKDYAPKDYIERLCMMPRLYLQEPHPQVPNGERYPLEEVEKTTGDYFSSSIAYLMALAIHEGAEEIGLFGVAMEGHDEYGYQRPNMEYLVGLARGLGIKVHIPEQSPLCKYSGQYGYSSRYGNLNGNH